MLEKTCAELASGTVGGLVTLFINPQQRCVGRCGIRLLTVVPSVELSEMLPSPQSL
jgi:hypothetical protein